MLPISTTVLHSTTHKEVNVEVLIVALLFILFSGLFYVVVEVMIVNRLRRDALQSDYLGPDWIRWLADRLPWL